MDKFDIKEFEKDVCIKCKEEFRCMASAGKRLCAGCYGEYLANQSIDKLVNKKALDHDNQKP